jgi:hypothetical protein
LTAPPTFTAISDGLAVSTSVSLATTSMSTKVSSVVLVASSTATGGWLKAMVTVAMFDWAVLGSTAR